jgi:hypothetical protein
MNLLGSVIIELLNYLFHQYEEKRGKIFWGIRLIFMGLVLTLFGLFIGTAVLISGANLDLFVAVGISLVVGIPCLIIGIYILKKPKKAIKSQEGSQKPQPETYNILDFVGEEEYRSLRWACILTTLGILFTFWGIAWLLWGTYSFFDPPQDFQPKDMLLIAIIAGDPTLLVGGMLLLIGIRKIKSVSVSETAKTPNKKTIDKKRSGGWILAGIGGLGSLWGILFIVLAIINSFVLPQTDPNISDAHQSIQCSILGLLIGLPLLFNGVWLIISTGVIKNRLGKINELRSDQPNIEVADW